MLVAVLLLSALLPLRVAAQNTSSTLSCARFPADAEAAKLAEQFGAANVVDAQVTGFDDLPRAGTVLFPDDPTRRIEILWRDETSKRRPSAVFVRSEQSRWETVSGVRVGADLRTLERMNGLPFRVGGFRTERSGHVLSWEGGWLAPLPSGICQPLVILQPEDDDPNGLFRQVAAGSSYASGHPALQKLNPRVVTLALRYHDQPPGRDPADTLLDALVFGMHTRLDPGAYAAPLRAAVHALLDRAERYRPVSPPERSGEMTMVRSARISYEQRLAAISDHVRAPQLARDYVEKLRPCYEWEGGAECPEREAQFADASREAHPDGPFAHYLPLLAAHRWLCAAEGYDYEKRQEAAAESRRRSAERLKMALRSEDLLIRTAAERLAARGTCLAPR